MRSPFTRAAVVLFLGASSAFSTAAEVSDADLERGFTEKVRPYLDTYCMNCHSGERPKAQFDLTRYGKVADVLTDHAHWVLLQEKLVTKEMPPENAKVHPTAEASQAVIDWIEALRRSEARKNAGDPGPVLSRRLSNAEYNYTIRDLTGADIRPAREFPVDPANQAGFDNSGESLAMSPALLNKYLQAAREVASHLVLKPDGIAFASHPMLVETDRDKYCVNQIMDFYGRINTDYSAYFQAAWQFKHRAALGKPNATLNEIAVESRVSPKYLATIWQALETREEVGPLAKVQSMWRGLPAPSGGRNPEVLAGSCNEMRDYIVQVRAKLEPRFPNMSAGRIGANSQPFLMWKNRQYASHRMTYDRGALQIDGKVQTQEERMARLANEPGAANEFGPGRTTPVNNRPGDPDLFVPAAEREKYEEAFARFSAVFPDAFYVAERGRNYLDKTRDRGRFLSAGFHNVMGYFRDDQPLYELVLDEAQQKQLDAMWFELDYVAEGLARTWIQFYFNESGEARGTGRESEGPRPADKEVTAEEMIQKVQEAYLVRGSVSSNAVAIQALKDHFDYVNETLRRVDRARIEAEPIHLVGLQEFATRAYRRPLTKTERDDLQAFYRSLRTEGGLEHEEAIRDSIVYVLMSPDFCYRLDLVDVDGGGADSLLPAQLAGRARPLSDFALANRLSYFLWASMPDAELLARAEAGDLHRPEVLKAQVRRMLRDSRVKALALEFGGNWLDFRRFEELNTVDRERFTQFDNELRQAMFEEPVRFMLDVFQSDRSALDFLYANHTFVNAALAKHYGMAEVNVAEGEWVRVDNADRYARGGILPMAAFLTQNAPGLRTSPVKRGYWVVKRVLGEHIPPPPAVVPELPRDESKMDLPLRDALAKHRDDPSCSSCHSRFDSLGLVFEGYGPVGERRTQDLAGRPVDARAAFPGNAGEGEGFEGLRKYVRDRRQGDFVDNLCRKMLAYALGRTLMLSDDPTIEQMRTKLEQDNYRFSSLIESIVTSPQFLTKRLDEVASNQ